MLIAGSQESARESAARTRERSRVQRNYHPPDATRRFGGESHQGDRIRLMDCQDFPPEPREIGVFGLLECYDQYMNRKGFAPIVIVLIVAAAALAAGACWYLGHNVAGGGGSDQKVPDSVLGSNTSEDCTLLPFTGKTPLNQVQYYSPGEQDLRGGMVCKFSINPQLPVFTLSFAGQADNTLGDITITEGANAKVIQTIPNTTSYDATLTKAENTIVPVDANFDGYKDLPILSDCGATGNCTYSVYLYNPTTNQFIKNSFLSNLGTPSFDAAKKQVTTSWNSSVADFETDTYQYQGGQYTLIQKIVSTSNGQNNTVTEQTFQLQNGKMMLINSTTTAGY